MVFQDSSRDSFDVAQRRPEVVEHGVGKSLQNFVDFSMLGAGLFQLVFSLPCASSRTEDRVKGFSDALERVICVFLIVSRFCSVFFGVIYHLSLDFSRPGDQRTSA